MNEIFLSHPGVVSCAGLNADELWNNVTSGKQDGIKTVTVSSGETFYAGRIQDERLIPTSARFDMRIHKIEEMALNQIASAVENAVEKFGNQRVAVCCGSCDNGTEFSVAGHRNYFSNGSFPENYSLEMQGADYVSTFISEKFDLKGPCLSFSTACSSSAEAMIKAAQLISSGIADAVVAGGVDIVSETVLLGFGSLEAVSPEITNPFSINRKGITLGEGAAFFVLSKEDIEDTGIKLLGYGTSCDAHHMTSPEPEGDGAARAMEEALNRSGLTAEKIDYINLHGTGTRFNDSMEAKAVVRVFGNSRIPASTTKPFTGHTLGAGSAVEAAICFMAVEKNAGRQEAVLPVHLWDGIRDNEIPDLNLVGKGKNIFNRKINICMSNSFAFGGANACLIVGKK